MKIRSLSPATVIATIALLFALSGTAVAAGVVTGAQILNGSIGSIDVMNESLRTVDIKNGTLLPEDFKGKKLPAPLRQRTSWKPPFGDARDEFGVGRR